MAIFQGKVIIGLLTVDANLSENHAVTVQATKFPVERGTDVSDHKRRMPDEITIEGVVTNTPVAGQFDNDFPNPTPSSPAAGFGQRGDDAHTYLDSLADSNDLVQIATQIKTYDNMQLTSLRMPRDVKTGDVFHFTATFQNIITVDTQVVQVVTRQSNGQPVTNAGRQANGAATAQQKATMIKTLTNYLSLTKAGSGVAP